MPERLAVADGRLQNGAVERLDRVKVCALAVLAQVLHGVLASGGVAHENHARAAGAAACAQKPHQLCQLGGVTRQTAGAEAEVARGNERLNHRAVWEARRHLLRKRGNVGHRQKTVAQSAHKHEKVLGRALAAKLDSGKQVGVLVDENGVRHGRGRENWEEEEKIGKKEKGSRK